MKISIRENIYIRMLTPNDAQQVFDVIDQNRTYLRKWLPWVDGTDSPSVIDGVLHKWEEQYKQGSDNVFGIFMNEKYIGNIGLHDIEPDNKKAVIGYWLAEQYQGKGIITDCVKSLIKYAFDELTLHTISIHCALDNAKSRAIPERLGFRETGILKDGENLYGVTHDMVIYSLEKLRLIFPTIEHKQAALDYKQEHIDNGETHIHDSSGFIHADNYENWLDKVTWNKTEATPDWVTGSVYFAIIDDKIVGTIAVRHYLNDSLLKSGGHIGYGVRPSERCKGYATQMLKLALNKCRDLGIEKAIVTCDKDNIGSARTILKNGGVLENEFINDDGVIEQRYWITL